MLQSGAVARQNWKLSSLMTLMLLARGKILTPFSIIHYIPANKPEGYFEPCVVSNVIFNSIAGDRLPTSAVAIQDSSSVDLCSLMTLRYKGKTFFFLSVYGFIDYTLCPELIKLKLFRHPICTYVG